MTFPAPSVESASRALWTWAEVAFLARDAVVWPLKVSVNVLAALPPANVTLCTLKLASVAVPFRMNTPSGPSATEKFSAEPATSASSASPVVSKRNGTGAVGVVKSMPRLTSSFACAATLSFAEPWTSTTLVTLDSRLATVPPARPASHARSKFIGRSRLTPVSKLTSRRSTLAFSESSTSGLSEFGSPGVSGIPRASSRNSSTSCTVPAGFFSNSSIFCASLSAWWTRSLALMLSTGILALRKENPSSERR